MPADYYTDRPTSFGLFGKLPQEAIDRGRAEALLVFVGNSADKYGGAIATNSSISIGFPDEVQAKVNKTWLGADGTELGEGLPDFIEVGLYRIDENGTEVLLEKAKLTAADNWSQTFTKLPSRGFVNGAETAFAYEVREVAVPEGFKAAASTEKTDDATYVTTLTNTREPTEPAPRIPATGDGAPFALALGLGLASAGALALFRRQTTGA